MPLSVAGWSGKRCNMFLSWALLGFCPTGPEPEPNSPKVLVWAASVDSIKFSLP